MTYTELNSMATQLKELKNFAAQIDDEITALEDAFKAEMTARQTEELTLDMFKVRWQTVDSVRIDTTALKKQMPDIAERFSKTTTSRRFSIV